MPIQRLSAASSSYDLDIGGNVATGVVDLGLGITSGEITIGGGSSRTGPIGIGNAISTGDIGIRTSTGEITIGPNQTSGILNLGTNAARTGDVVVGNAANTGDITINTSATCSIGSNATTLNAGSSASTINIGASSTGTCNIMTNATNTNPITIGNTSRTGDIQVRTGGKLFLNAEFVLSSRGVVTQTTSVTTGVTLNSGGGTITTVALTLASGATAEFIVTNSLCSAASLVLASVHQYAGSGILTVSTNTIGAGTFRIRLCNSGLVALDAFSKISFLVL